MAGEVAPPTLDIPLDRRPRHIAIIMDGNGRWAERQSLPRIAGHERASHLSAALPKNVPD